MMRLVDVHSHSNFSIDSKNTMEASCEAGILKGLRGVSITDHLDFNPKEWGVGTYDRKGYFEEIQRVRRIYGDRIQILSGVEFSESQIYGDQLEEISQFPYDVILGSIHWIDVGYIGDKDILKVLTQEEAEIRYFDAIRKVIQFGKIDVLAHLDLPKRSFGSRCIHPEILTQILIELVQSNIALEINTSTLRMGLTETLPELSLVEEFVRLGGKRITLGSDAHFSENLGANFVEVLKGLSEEAKACVGYFVERKFVRLWEQEKEELLVLLEDYRRRYANSNILEAETIDLFEKFVRKEFLGLTQAQIRGHITGSAWIVNKSKTKVLLTHHKKLNIWVQLGGHVEVNESVLQGATREAFEESGLLSIQLVSPQIFDLDAHVIPERNSSREHIHFDIRFCFMADENEKLVITPESKDLKWVSFCEIERYTCEESILRMVRKGKYL